MRHARPRLPPLRAPATVLRSDPLPLPVQAGLPKMLHTNFYEKALFVKTDVAVALCGRVQLLRALRALCFYPL